MSVQFGRWNCKGDTPGAEYIDKVSAALAPYGPDTNEVYANGGVTILYRAFHTTKESHREVQPHVSGSRAVVTWDGRLDNRAELIGELRLLSKTNSATVQSVTADSASINGVRKATDVEIVARAYERWGVDCLGKLIGDWAVSIWNPSERSVILATDFVGKRHLYYSMENEHVTWSTILDPLVLFAGKTFEICEEYVAGWFATIFPAAHLTPYVGIRAVPPSSSVVLRLGKDGVKHIVSKYWDFDPGRKVRYRTDAEYEEHFRSVFGTAVQRTLRSDRPVLAELSGGVDSSSIVCMADKVIARGQAECPLLDTVTWYDECNPSWGERPYFTKIEEKRGRVGCHIDFGTAKQGEQVDSNRSFLSEFENDRLAATPFSNKRRTEHFEQYEAYIRSGGYRVTLSGIGGEEATGGGVPTPRPELQDLLARARLFTLAHQLNAWAVKMRKPRLALLWEAVRGFFPAPVNADIEISSAPWFHPDFVRRNHVYLYGHSSRVKLFGPLPSFQDYIHELNHVRRFLAACGFHSKWLREVRYPYLDRNLLEFVYAIPREQLVRIGQRRSLMKRALIGIVPDELLNRRKKAAVTQEPQKNASTEWPSSLQIGPHVVSGSIGIIDPHRFEDALQKARHREEVAIDSLKRTLLLESWVRHLSIQRVLTKAMVTKRPEYPPSLEVKELQASAQPKGFS